MTQEWLSQSNVIKNYDLNINDLHSNIHKVVDETKTKWFESDVTGKSIKIAKNPLVALTLRLVDNPRGYEAPMRLYNISQIQDLESSLIKHTQTHPQRRTEVKNSSRKTKKNPSKKQTSNKIKTTATTALHSRALNESCDVSGHQFEPASQTQEVCKRCKMTIESETI